MPRGGIASQNTHLSTQESYASPLPGELSDDSVSDALVLQALADAENEMVCHARGLDSIISLLGTPKTEVLVF